MSDTTTPQDPQPENAPQPERPASTFSASFKNVLSRMSTKASEGGGPKTIRRRRATFVVDYEGCEPDAFQEDFRLTIEGLNADQELEALKTAADGASMGLALAKRSLREFNGNVLQAHERDILWDLLGFAGRMVVVSEYMKHCTGVGDGLSLGKSLGVELS